MSIFAIINQFLATEWVRARIHVYLRMLPEIGEDRCMNWLGNNNFSYGLLIFCLILSTLIFEYLEFFALQERGNNCYKKNRMKCKEIISG